MRVVLLDTSLMLDCVKLKLDVFTGLEGLMEGLFEVRVSEGVLGELRAMAKGRGMKASEARVALALLEQKALVEKGGKAVDDWLVSRGKELDAVVCTNDGELRTRLKKAGVRVVSIRGRSRLDYV